METYLRDGLAVLELQWRLILEMVWQFSKSDCSCSLDMAGNYIIVLQRKLRYDCQFNSSFKTIPKSTFRYEPQHDKTNNVACGPAKIQISLGIRPV